MHRIATKKCTKIVGQHQNADTMHNKRKVENVKSLYSKISPALYRTEDTLNFHVFSLQTGL